MDDCEVVVSFGLGGETSIGVRGSKGLFIVHGAGSSLEGGFLAVVELDGVIGGDSDEVAVSHGYTGEIWHLAASEIEIVLRMTEDIGRDSNRGSIGGEVESVT